MATPSKNRWELEEKRKKQKQQQALAAAQNALKSGAAYKGNAVSNNVQKAAAASTAQKTTTPKANTVTVSKPQGANIPTFLQGSGRTTAEKVSTPKQQNGFSSLQTLAEMPKTVQSIGNSVLQTSNDMRNLQRNSLLWHGTTDANERARLKSENDAIRKRLGLSYDNGNTYNPRTGQNLSQMTDMLYGSSAATRANTATQYAANQLPQILSQQASVRSQEDEEKGIAERVMETIEASTKRVRAGLDNWFATGNIAADEEAEQKFLAGEELGWLDQLRMKERWGENWESYLSGVRDAYQTGNTAIIEDYEQRARALNNLYDTTSLFDEAAQQAEAAKAGLSTAGKTALDALGMGADMLGAASIASTGGGGAGLFTGVSSVSAAGQAADQARRMGANAAQQEDYGNAVGALNFAVERLGGIGGGQAAAKIANRMLPEAVKNAAGKVTSTAVGRVLAGGAEEGLEGALQSEGERALRNVILDENERFDPAKFGVDIGYNALMGSLFRGGQEVAGTVLGGMRQGQTGNAAAQQAQQTNDTTTVSSSGFLLPEAKRQRMAAQDAAYAAQIDDVFRGNMPTDRAVSIGDTPDILLSIGATDLPMTMKQSTARKIAFPAGYMGGAHNLGVPALKRLPEQLRDPAAVLRSKTQPDSFVVLTEWNDTNGNPVIIALHLDKQGVVDVTNEVASAYGKNNFAALTGENGENVLYTKNNKSIDQILDDRLQLPALLSDDTLVAYSIAQQAEKSNAEQETQALGRRLAELDAQKRQAEGLLPGPIRDRAIAEAEQAMQEVQQQATQTGAQQTTSDPGAQVPASEAMQYGKSPELAMMEARERARNAAAQAARDQQIVQDIERSEGAIRSDNPYYGLTRQQLENELAFAKQRIERARKDKNSDKAGRLLNQYRQIEQAIEDAKVVSFKAGDRVFALDQNNFGEIVKDRGDGYFDVYFVNTQTGENGIHTLHGDLLQSIMPGEDVPRVTPQEAAERAGEIYDYSPEAFDRLLEENETDQYADLPARDYSRFGNGKLRDGLGQDEQIRRDIEDMANEADQQGQQQIIPESVALNIDRVKMAYNKTLERVLDEAAGKSREIRQFLQNTIEKPLAAAKSLYARSIKSQMDSYYKDMQQTGIKLGSKESAAVMWYGEGKRMNEAGEYVDYTLADLKRDFPDKWKDIIKADSINRRIYDEYIGKIQQARREVYPYAEQRVELAISRKRAQAAAFSEQVKNLDAKISAGNATPADMASRNQLMRELQAAEKDLAQKIKDRDSGKAFANQRLFPRKDYYHHAMELAEGFSALKNIIETDMSIDPRLVGTSDHTKPKAKWSGILQKRKGVNALEDSVAAMLDYIPQAEYMINIDPQVARLRTVVRDLVDGTANADQTNANSLIEWLTDYTNDLAGKTNPFDRALQKVFSRKAFKAIEWINGRAKSNAILGNLNSAVAQVYNLPNGLAYVKDPRDISRGMTDFVAAKVTDGEARRALDESGFMTERYLDSAKEQFDESLLHKPKQFATWLLTAGDEQVSQMIWFSAYEQAKRKGVSDPIFYADDMTKRAVAGRGVGEVPLMQKAKMVKLIAPFQVEVSNAYYVLKEKVGAKDALGLTLLFLSTFLLNEVKEDLTGTRTGMDLIDAGSDAIKEVLDPEYEGGMLSKLATVGGRLGGEVLSNMPFGAQIASTLISDETRREKLFGESDPTRFGTGNIGIDTLIDPISQFASGQQVNPWDVATGILLPWGGKQVSRAVDMAEDYGLLPVFRVSQNGVRFDKQDTNAAYSEDGSQLKYVADTDIGNILKGLAFGRYATDAGKEYIENGMKMLSEAKTETFKKGVTEQGMDEATLYDAIVRMSQAESVKDETGKTITSAKEAARRLLFDREDMTPEQKKWLDKQLLVDPDSDQTPADYTDYTSFVLSMYDSESRREAAEQAVQHGLTVDQFVQWDDRLRELTNEKGTDDKKVRTAAEARSMVLDEVLQNSALLDSEKEAIADYVIISSIGEEDEKTRQNWENIAKGKVNASDFVRFQADASIYGDWAEGTDTDNAANVAKILRGYEGLTDEQRDVLFQTYRDNMSVNPFHVSVYEKAIDPNGSFFSALTDDGKARLRSLLNEYEQDINEGAELDEWRAKAYMAEKEAGIAPGIYAMYRVALETANTDGKGNPRQSEAEACVNAMDGLTQYQKAYLYASTNSSWKNNPFGNATVGEYSSGLEIGINPIEGGTVTSGFGPRDSFQTDNGAMSSSNHPSIDIGAPEGTPIGAYKSGKVTKNGWVDGYGWTIEVTHGDGTVSAYHHMMEQSPVSVGTEVTQGDQIGKVGQTGNSKGAHLDLTITRDGKPIDPASLIPELKDSATGYVWTGSNVYTNVTSGSGKSSSGSGSGKNSSLKNLNDLLNLDSLF